MKCFDQIYYTILIINNYNIIKYINTYYKYLYKRQYNVTKVKIFKKHKATDNLYSLINHTKTINKIYY